MVEYGSISNATLTTVLTYLQDEGIASSRIVNIFHDGTSYVAVWTIA